MEPTRCEAVVVGTGFGGIAAAVALRRQGVDDVVMLERRDFAGGTWCQNTYPGAQVDVPSPLYSLSTDLHDWTELYARRHELEAYTEGLLDRHDLRRRIVLGAEVTALRWDEDRGRWDVTTADGRAWDARLVVAATGPLSDPRILDLPGRSSFEGAQFHTNAWRHDVDLDGRTVGVIGLGASAAQVIPAIAERVGALHVFLRTPPWVLFRPDHTFTPWQRRLLRHSLPHKVLRSLIYLGLESRVVGLKYSDRLIERQAARPAREHLAAQVPDPALRAKLTPDYTLGCKRVILSNDLYPALSRPEVHVHDATEAVQAMTPQGVRLSTGEVVPLDVLVHATGFRAVEGATPFSVTGRGGRTLHEAWSAFPRAYLGTTVPGFPNLFLMLGPNTGIGHTSALFIMEAQLAYLTRSLDAAAQRDAGWVDVRPEAEEAYTTWVHEEMEGTVWRTGGCKSWYQGADGRVIAIFPGFSFTFWRWCRRFRPEHHAFGG